jgi:hypothetical protein
MKSKTTFKCLHCREKRVADPRNRVRQCYCGKLECQKASKAASQRQWAGKKENENYFRGEDNIERVRQWRKAHPGYWRRKRAGKEDALQDPCTRQDAGCKEVVESAPPDALQDLCLAQPALLVGIISVMTGHGLQEDIAASARSFLTRGADILRMGRRECAVAAI